jgi:hypothetical protein
MRRMRIRKINKRFLFLILGLFLVIGGAVFYYYSPFGVQAMMSPPPAAHRFLLAGAGPEISKFLGSQAIRDEGGGLLDADSTSNTSPAPVIYGEELTVHITFTDGSLGTGEINKIKRVVEVFPDEDRFEFRGAYVVNFSSSGGMVPVSPNEIRIGDPVSGTITYDFTSLGDGTNVGKDDTFEFVAFYKATKDSNVAFKIERPGSRLVYSRSGQLQDPIDLPEAWVQIRDLLGPVGDVYAEGSINPDLAPEQRGIDVLASGSGIDGYYKESEGVDWKLPHYNLKVKDQSYLNYYQNLRDRVINRLKNELAEEVTSGSQLMNKLKADPDSSQPQVYYYPSGLTIDNDSVGGGNLRVRGKKVVIIDGNLFIDVNMIKCLNDRSDQLVLLLTSKKGSRDRYIYFSSWVDDIDAFIFGPLGPLTSSNVVFQPGGHLRIRGALVSQKIILGNPPRKVTFRYNSQAVSGLPGIQQLLDPITKELAP